jgi:hypothetical protein
MLGEPHRVALMSWGLPVLLVVAALIMLLNFQAQVIRLKSGREGSRQSPVSSPGRICFFQNWLLNRNLSPVIKSKNQTTGGVEQWRKLEIQTWLSTPQWPRCCLESFLVVLRWLKGREPGLWSRQEFHCRQHRCVKQCGMHLPSSKSDSRVLVIREGNQLTT